MTSALVVRQVVTPGRPYDRYRQELRSDFYWSCAYCTIAETEAQAIRFEIDHYEPQSAGGTDEYSNLYYSCGMCNVLKTSVPPLDQLKIIRIDIEDSSRHLELTSGFKIRHLTPIGRHNILVLELNRLALRRLRELRDQLQYDKQLIEHGMRIIKRVQIDLLPQSVRGAFLKHRQQMLSKTEIIEEQIGEFIQNRCRSPLIDPDPDLSTRKREKLEYLRSIGVMLPNQRRGR